MPARYNYTDILHTGTDQSQVWLSELMGSDALSVDFLDIVAGWLSTIQRSGLAVDAARGETRPNGAFKRRAGLVRTIGKGRQSFREPVGPTNTVKYYYCMRLAASFAGVSKPGQRSWIQGPVTKVFVGSNPIPRTIDSFDSDFREFAAFLNGWVSCHVDI